MEPIFCEQCCHFSLVTNPEIEGEGRCDINGNPRVDKWRCQFRHLDRMSPKDCAKILEHYNKWRRDDNVPNAYVQPHPYVIGLAIDKAIELLNNNKQAEIKTPSNYYHGGIDYDNLREWRGISSVDFH